MVKGLFWMCISPLMLAACASQTRSFTAGDQAPPGVRKEFLQAESERSCRSLHGHWAAVHGRPEFPQGGYCQFKTSDAGHACRSSRDCEGYCEVSFDDMQDESRPRCSSQMPPRWDRCVPGYYENGKVLGRGECFGEDSEVQ